MTIEILGEPNYYDGRKAEEGELLLGERDQIQYKMFKKEIILADYKMGDFVSQSKEVQC